MFKKIIAKKNLEAAYLKMAQDMELDGRSYRYCGWDSWKLSDIELRSAEILDQIQTELKEFKSLVPAVLFKIPKKSNPQKFREIYIYNLKERIKAQAIYQIVEPIFDQYFSPYLYSYRSSHSSYFAARSVTRHYKKYHQRDFVFIGDLSDYSNYTGHRQLKEKIKALNLGEDVERLLFLFIGNEVVRDGAITKPKVGLVQGVPLIALFNNLYLDDFDKYVGPKTDFYRRVGDDLILFAREEKRLLPLQAYLTKEADDLGLKINQEKSALHQPGEDFNFLGYHFSQGLISLPANYKKALLLKWRQQFSYYYSRSEDDKKRYLQRMIHRDRQNLKEQFDQLAEQKKFVNDERQLRDLSESFFRILTRYFFKDYTERNRRLLPAKLKRMGLSSVYKHFVNTRYGAFKGKN